MALDVSSGEDEMTRLIVELGSLFRDLMASNTLSSPCSDFPNVDLKIFDDPWDLPCRAKMDKEIFSDHHVLVGTRSTLVGKRLGDLDGRPGQGDQHEPHQFPKPRHLLLEHWKNTWDSAHDDHGLNMATPKEEDSVHCSVRARRAFLRDPAHDEKDSLHCSSVRQLRQPVRFSTGDIFDNMLTLDTCSRIALSCAEALAYVHSKIDSIDHTDLIDSIDHTDLKPSNILLDSKTVPRLANFGLSKRCQSGDIVKMVPTHNRPVDAKFSGKSSEKRDIEKKIGFHMRHCPRYLSVHHHPLIKMLPSARKWSGDILTSCARLITSKRTFCKIYKGWISAKPKYEAPNAGPVIRNGLNVNESQQHSIPDSRGAKHAKMAVNTTTSASWIIATAAPHHATGDCNLLSGFTMEHDDLFVHSVNRVPMKVLARGAVVTDTLILPDVWFVPGLTQNLVSVSQLSELDHSIGFGRGECCIRSARDAKIVGKGCLQKGGNYVLDYLKIPLAI